MKYKGTMVVKAVGSTIHELDKNVIGEYPFTVEANDALEAEENITDKFHETVPVKVLEDFMFHVKDLKKEQ